MAATDAVYACETCGLSQRVERLAPGNSAECIRCGSVIVSRPFGGMGITAARTVAALVPCTPANIYPILSMSIYGTYTENTVWDGVVSLMNYNQYFIAVVVFLASIVIPLIKLIGLLFLVISVKWSKTRRMRGRTKIYKFIDVIGPWAMLDVFLVAILV